MFYLPTSPSYLYTTPHSFFFSFSKFEIQISTLFRFSLKFAPKITHQPTYLPSSSSFIDTNNLTIYTILFLTVSFFSQNLKFRFLPSFVSLKFAPKITHRLFLLLHLIYIFKPRFTNVKNKKNQFLYTAGTNRVSLRR